MLVVVLGGARSGKSRFAEALARRRGAPVSYLATAPRIEGDHDLDDRIARHRADRPAGWTTIEEEVDLAAAIRRAGSDHLIVDCLTVWVGNLVHHGHADDDVRRASAEAIAAVADREGDTTVVSNEVGLGVVPEHPLGRRYRDLLGRVNQDWAAAADHTLLLVAGRAVALTDPWELLP